MKKTHTKVVFILFLLFTPIFNTLIQGQGDLALNSPDRMPYCFSENTVDSLYFGVNLITKAYEATGITLSVEVEKENTILYRDTILVGNQSTNDTNFIYFDKALFVNEVGEYSVTYNVTGNELEATPEDNETSYFFKINHDEGLVLTPLAYEDGADIGGAYNSFDYDVGNYFFFPNSGFYFYGISFSVLSREDLQDKVIPVSLYKIVGNSSPFSINDLELTSYVDYTLGEGNYLTPYTQVRHIITEKNRIQIEEGTEWFAMITLNDTSVYFGADTLFDYNNNISTILIDGNEVFLGGVAPFINSDVRVYVGPYALAANDIQLDPSKIKTYPNPTTNEIHLELELKEMDDVEVTIIKEDGQLMLMEQLHRYQNEGKTYNTSAYATGNYIMYVKTKEGIGIKKFVVIK